MRPPPGSSDKGGVQEGIPSPYTSRGDTQVTRITMRGRVDTFAEIVWRQRGSSRIKSQGERTVDVSPSELQTRSGWLDSIRTGVLAIKTELLAHVA
jgi:hypothetical protein